MTENNHQLFKTKWYEGAMIWLARYLPFLGFIHKSRLNRWRLENNDFYNSVKKATFAYHMKRGESPNAHYFLTGLRDSVCYLCGRTREQVRWDDLPAECSCAKTYDIGGTILKEEESFEAVKNRAKKIADSSRVENMTGKNLCVLHHTHGIDPSILECVGCKISQQQHDDYLAAYEKHRETGKRGQKNQEIRVKQ